MSGIFQLGNGLTCIESNPHIPLWFRGQKKPIIWHSLLYNEKYTLVLPFAVSSVETSTRGLTFADPLLIIILYHCTSGLRWYLYSRLKDDRVNSADKYTANISTYTVYYL